MPSQQAVEEMHERLIAATCCTFENSLIKSAMESAGDNLHGVVELLQAYCAELVEHSAPGSFARQNAESMYNALTTWLACRSIGRAVMNHNVLGTPESREVERLALLLVPTIEPDKALTELLARTLIERARTTAVSGTGAERLSGFKDELRALLEKYGASIDVGYADCSDTHGMYDERMEVSFNHDRSVFRIADNWGLDASDLRQSQDGDE